MTRFYVAVDFQDPTRAISTSIDISENQMEIPLDEFCERFAKPAIAALRSEIKRRKDIIAPLPPSRSVKSDKEELTQSPWKGWNVLSQSYRIR